MLNKIISIVEDIFNYIDHISSQYFLEDILICKKGLFQKINIQSECFHTKKRFYVWSTQLPYKVEYIMLDFTRGSIL